MWDAVCGRLLMRIIYCGVQLAGMTEGWINYWLYSAIDPRAMNDVVRLYKYITLYGGRVNRPSAVYFRNPRESGTSHCTQIEAEFLMDS